MRQIRLDTSDLLLFTTGWNFSGKDLPLDTTSRDSSHGQSYTSPDSFTRAQEKYKQGRAFNQGENRTVTPNPTAGLLCLAAAVRAAFGT